MDELDTHVDFVFFHFPHDRLWLMEKNSIGSGVQN